jgi:hypothetical protein
MIQVYIFLIILIPCFYFCFSPLHGQETDVMASGELIVQGVRLEITPAQQTVPINTETVVNTVFSVDEPELVEGMMVKGTLRGPGIKDAITLTTLPNHPFAIPGFTSKGTYTLENIHLAKDGKILVTAEPEQAVIEAMDIIVTKVESRPLTLEEIREKGIVISEENFSVYNFSVGFVVNSQEVKYEFPIVYSGNNEVYIPQSGGGVGAGIPGGPRIREPVPILFELPEIELPEGDIDTQGTSRPVSGVVLFNNDIAFLNQFFSVMFIVSNHAPAESSLALKEVTAKITFPDGLREAETNPPHLMGAPVPVRCPGPDGKIGTADDLDIILATFSGMAEFLAEGLEEGTHIVDIDFEGTLSGLPSGDTPFTGTASGAVIVRNPEFGITFAHPSVIRKGEEYDIYVTMTNTSPVVANLVSLTMPATRLVGTSLLSDETVSWETIEPGESVTAQFHMRSNETGKIRASAFEVDGSVSGRFVLTAGVGEKGIPLSPDTLVLPDWAYSLPNELINASLILLGEAYSIATTPPGGLPEGLPYISSDLVKERAMEFAEAGQRYTYGDSLINTVEVLTLDWLGSRLQDINFDILRRLTSKGLKFAQQQAIIFNEALASQSAQEFQRYFAENCSYKPPFISALLSFGGGSRNASLRITDFYQNKLSNEQGDLDLIRQIPYGELYLMEDAGQSPVDFALVGHPDENGYTVEVIGEADGTFELSLIVPDTSGGFRQVVFPAVSSQLGSVASITITSGDTGFTLSLDNNGDGQVDSQVTGGVTPVPAPPLQLLGAVQECSADSAGHATALFFNRPLDPETAKDKTNYYVTDKSIYASFLQPSGRVVLIGTNNPISPFVESRIRVENLKDTSEGLITPSPVEMPIISTIKTAGGIVFGKVFSAQGEPIANARIQLVERNGSKRTLSFDISDSTGSYQFDFVRILPDPFTIEVQDVNTGKIERVSSRLMSNGQRLQIDIIMRGRGSVQGRVLDVNATPLANAAVSARAENTGVWESYSTDTNEQGEYMINDIPIGHVTLSAAKAGQYGSASTAITAPDQIQTVDITVVSAKTAKVSGRVFYNDGVTPAVEAYVNFFGEHQYASGTKTDEQGYFQFPSVPIGTFNIKAYNPLTGSQGGYVTGELVENQDFSTTIIFRGTGRIHGKVLSYDGVPQTSVFVYLSGTSFYMDTDSNGNFDFQEVPVGNYIVIAKHRTVNLTASSSVKLITEGQETYVSLVFPNTLLGSITGTVYDVDGTTPMPDTDVYVCDGHYIARGVATSNQNGAFTVENLSTGSYIIFIARPDSTGVAHTMVQFPGHQTVCDVKYLGKGKVNINVFASDGQTRVIADVIFRRIVFEMEEGQFIGFRGIEERYTSNETGPLEIDEVYMGNFSVSAQNAFYPRGASYYGKITSPGQEVDVDLVMKPSGKVKVTVKDWDGQTPIAGVALEFKAASLPWIKDIFTGQDGTYEFTLVPPGNFRITALDTVSGLRGICYGTMGTDGDLVEVTLRLLGTGQVSGVVKTDQLVPNAAVTLRNVGFPHQIFETKTDENGQFTISGVWEGQFTVSAFDPVTRTGGRTQGEVPGHNAQVNVEVLLDPVGTIKGRVMSPDGVSEMIDAQVVLYHSKFNYKAVGYFYVSQEGGYIFENVPSGNFYLEALHPASGRKGKKSGSLETTGGGEIVEVDVYLEGRGTVTGTFYDGSGVNPVPHAGIKIRSQGIYPFTLESTTDAQGNFTFAEVAQGEFDLDATDPANGLKGSASGQVQYDGETVYIDVIAQGWGSVKGKVYKADGTLDTMGARVALKQGSKTYGAYADTTTGEYHIEFVPMGSFTVYAYEYPGERDYGSASGKIEFHGQVATVDITFKGLGSVTGRVLDGSGNPEPGISVTLTSGYEKFTTNTDSDGIYGFNQLRMGLFSLEAKQAVTNLSASGSGELTENGQTVTVDLILDSAGSVTGRILNPDGTTPAENAYLILKGTNFTKYFHTGTSGEFQFNAVRLGGFTLEVQGYNQEGKTRVSGQVDNDGDIVNVGDLVLDSTIPQVNAIIFPDGSAVNGSAGIPLSTSFTILFSEEIAASSITGSTIYLNSSQGKVSGTLELQPDGKSVVFTPPLLSSFILYTLNVTTAVEDIAGNTLAAAVTASFTTSDIQPPVVVAVNPAHNAVGVPIDAVIIVTFNEPVDDSKFSSQNFVVKKGDLAGGEPVNPQSLVFDETKTSVTFVPDSPLLANASYTIWLNNFYDFSNNLQTAAFTSHFSAIDTLAPTFKSIEPADGTTVTEGASVTVTVTFNESDIAVVHFFINGESRYSDTTAPYKYQFPAPLISDAGSSIQVEVLAVDRAGNQSTKANLTIYLKQDTPPQITLTGPAAPTVLPNGTIDCSVTASDDLGLSRVIVTAVGGTLNYSNTQNISNTSFTKNYSIAVPADIMPGTDIILHAHAIDIRGNVTDAEDIPVHVPQDEQNPIVSITSPTEGSRFKHNEEINITADASDDVGLKEVRIYLDDQLLATHTQEPYTATYTVPPLEQEKQSAVKVEAEDLSGKVSQDTVNIVQEQLVDLTAPQVRIITPSDGTLVFAGENLKIKVEATDDEGIDQLEIFVDDELQQTFTQIPFEMNYSIPSGAEPGSTIAVKAVATDVDNKTGTEQVVLEVVTGTLLPAGTLIEANNPGYDNQTIIINEGTVTINGEHAFLNVLVKETGHLTHTGCDTIDVYSMALTVTGKVVVGPDAKIDSSAKGYMGARQTVNSLTNASDYGLTLGNQPGSYYESGGSYGGYGGQYQSYKVTTPYGSPYDPSNHGSGGGGHSSYRGGNGGGVIRVQASGLVLDGQVAADGGYSLNHHYAGGGAGGSIYLKITALTGSGLIRANGGYSKQRAGGGGGRIAVYYDNAAGFDLNTIIARGGIGYLGEDAKRNGSPGTIYLEKAGQPGEMIVRDRPDTDSLKGTQLKTPAPGTITALEDGKLTDTNADFIPGSLVGMLLQPNINNPKIFVITSNNETGITVEYQAGDGLTNNAQVGDQYLVKHRGAIVVEDSNVYIDGNAAVPSLLLYNSTLTVDGILEADQLTLQSGSIITHTPTLLGTTYTLSIKAEELDIGEGCGIDVNGRGYPGAHERNNTSNDDTGVTYPNTLENGSMIYCGGSYGGYGGKYGSSYDVNKPYGSITAPVDPGSGGGGNHSSYHGTSGGGVIRIETGTLTLNGTITANGISLLGYHGAGSGGSIHIDVSTVSGQGTIQANGGNSNSQCGAGSGGRIALKYEDASQFDLNLITAYGGMHATGSDPLRNAGAGTIYLEKTNDQAQLPRLVIKNRGQDCWRSLIFPMIEPSQITSISGKVLENTTANYMPGSLAGMTLIPNINDPENTYLITDNDSTTITVDRDIIGAQAGDTYKGLMVFDGHLEIVNSISEISRDVELSTLTLSGNGVLRHPGCTATSETYLFIKAADRVIIESGSRIDVSEMGYPGGYQNNLGNTGQTGSTLESLPGGGSVSRNGGSYGGQGGAYGSEHVGLTYGSLYKPLHPGAGGGGYTSQHPGGNGGGAVRIVSPLLELNGAIYANGTTIGYGKYGGAGAGGSILLEIKTIKGSGEIAANGGGNWDSAASGGGRAALYYENINEFNITNIHAYGGLRTYLANPKTNGGAGTIYLNDMVNNRGELVVDNNNIDTNYQDRYSTPLPAVGQGIFTMLEVNLLENTTAAWVPGALTGIKLNPNPIETTLFAIISNTGTEIFTDAADGNMTETPQTGGQYIGEHHLFNVTVKGSARLFTTDRIQVSGTLTVEPGSALKAENHQ